MTALDVSVQEARAFASSTVFSATSRRAFVAPSPTIFGMLRLWETYQEFSQTPTQARIFHDLASALKWLGLEGLPYVTKADAKDAAAAKAPKNEKTG